MATRQVLGRVLIVMKGEYNNTEEYEKLDVVTYDGSSYIAKKDTVGNLPTNTEFWDLLAKKGDDNAISDEDLEKVKNEVTEAIKPDVQEGIKEDLDKLINISPLVASSIDEMTDTTRVYVNTTDGNWYYYNGANWEIGGLYQATKIQNNSISSNEIEYKGLYPDSINYLDGYNRGDEKLVDSSISYDGPNRALNNDTLNYSPYMGDNFRSIKTRIPNNSYIIVEKESTSDRFKIGLFDTEPQSGDPASKIILNIGELSSQKHIAFYSENYNWLVCQYTASGEKINVKVKVINRFNIDNIIDVNNTNFFEKIKAENLYDKSMILNDFACAIQGYLSYVTKCRTLKFTLIPDNTYTIRKIGNSNRFRLWLFNYKPKKYESGDSLDNFLQSHPSKIIIDDNAATEVSFDSEKYKYAFLTYTTNNEDCSFEITNSSGTKYQLNKEFIVNYLNELKIDNIQKIDGGYIFEDDINSSNEIWTQWDSRLAFGMTPSLAPVPLRIKSQLLVDGTIIARNQKNQKYNRWGYHVYEAYGSNNYDRITMLMNKHDNEINKKVAELYYYTGASHYATSYAWYRIGSDVKNHSFMFDRDTMVAYGLIDLKNVMTLARISPTNDLITTYNTIEEADKAYEPENNAENNAKCLLYISLKNAENGSMFYDTDRNKIVIKVNNKWCDMNVTEVEEGTYNF